MKFEVLKKNNLKRNIVIGGCVVLIISAVVLNFTRAKYRSTASVPIVNSTVNYKVYDLKVLAMYQENEAGEYVSIDVMPSSWYVINESESYCTVDGVNKDNNARLYTNDNGEHVIANLQKKSKCYLYFDEYVQPIKDVLLSYYPTVLTRTDFSKVYTTKTANTVFVASDNDGTTYYFAGAATDNWVYFAGFYWRIIRINGDGSIRLIYQGTSATATGNNTQTGTSAFNSSMANNMHVGFMYTEGNVHGNGTSSTIKEVLDQWYQDNLLEEHNNYIDINAGFCGDRTPSTSDSNSNGLGGTWSTTTYYGAYIRLYANKEPTFECLNEDDLYTIGSSNKGNRALIYPIGLITADEIAFAGGVYNLTNKDYYLYTGSYYWTMSPFKFISTFSQASVFVLTSSSAIIDGWFFDTTVNNTYGVRPVINLKADVTISSGNGTSSTPFVIAS